MAAWIYSGGLICLLQYIEIKFFLQFIIVYVILTSSKYNIYTWLYSVFEPNFYLEKYLCYYDNFVPVLIIHGSGWVGRTSWKMSAKEKQPYPMRLSYKFNCNPGVNCILIGCYELFEKRCLKIQSVDPPGCMLNRLFHLNTTHPLFVQLELLHCYLLP